MTKGLLATGRVTQLLRLVREAAEESAEARKLHLAAGLRSVVGCELVAFVEFPRVPVEGTAALALHAVGFDAASERQAKVLFGTTRGTTIDPASRAIAARTGARSHTIANRRELVSDDDWYGSEYVETYRRAWGIDHMIYSAGRRADGSVLAMAFGRAWGDRNFTEEDGAIARLFHGECAWVLDGEVERREAVRARLAPRVRQTLDELLRGASSKEIADRLGLSVHTVRQYQKTLHRAFGVQSRGELLARFVTR